MGFGDCIVTGFYLEQRTALKRSLAQLRLPFAKIAFNARDALKIRRRLAHLLLPWWLDETAPQGAAKRSSLVKGSLYPLCSESLSSTVLDMRSKIYNGCYCPHGQLGSIKGVSRCRSP